MIDTNPFHRCVSCGEYLADGNHHCSDAHLRGKLSYERKIANQGYVEKNRTFNQRIREGFEMLNQGENDE